MDTKALRQKILDLAIRGKLVPQDPNDEPASVLLERIRQQKQQMVKEGKLKPKDIKNDSFIFVGEDNLHYEKFADGSVKCIEDEIPFDIPGSWAWARTKTVSVDLPYGTSKKSNFSGKVAVLRMGNLQDGEIDYSDLVYSSDEEDIEKYYLLENDLLFNRTNSAEWVGKTSIYRGDTPAIYAGYLIRIRTPLCGEYLNAVMNSVYAKNYCIRVKTDAVNQSNINAQKLGTFLVPVAPIKEQHRIVTSFKRTFEFTQCIQSGKKELSALIQSAKAKILDLAIRGQLVPQDPADEPASVLLDRIRTEKEELIKQGKLKRDKKESVIFCGEDNSYYVRQDTHTESINEQFIFELPGNWEWCSLLNIAKIELGKTLDSAKNIGTNYPYLRSMNVRWNEVDLSDLKEMRFEPEELDRYTVRRNDLLICEGGDVGRSCVWTDEKEILYQNALHRVRFYGGCNPFYFMYYMMYYESRGIIKTLCKGVTIKHLTGNVLSLIPFALPPIEEQGRIVERLNRIFVLLDSIICD